MEAKDTQKFKRVYFPIELALEQFSKKNFLATTKVFMVVSLDIEIDVGLWILKIPLSETNM